MDIMLKNNDPVIRAWVKERAKWLKDELLRYGYGNTAKSQLIDQAFQLTPEVCDKCGQEIKP